MADEEKREPPRAGLRVDFERSSSMWCQYTLPYVYKTSHTINAFLDLLLTAETEDLPRSPDLYYSSDLVLNIDR